MPSDVAGDAQPVVVPSALEPGSVTAVLIHPTFQCLNPANKTLRRSALIAEIGLPQPVIDIHHAPNRANLALG